MNKLENKFFVSVVFVLLLGVTFAIGTVKAESNNMTCVVRLAEFKEAYGSDNPEFDFNNDGVVNIVDLGLISQDCDVKKEEPKEEPIKTKESVRKTTKGLRAVPQLDGSISYEVKGKAFQLPNGQVIRWTEGVMGIIIYDCNQYTVEDGVGVNVKLGVC